MQFPHLDIGYTAPQLEVAKIAVDALDNVLTLCPEHNNFRWTVESLWQFEQWMQQRSPEQVAQLMTLVKQRRISLSG